METPTPRTDSEIRFTKAYTLPALTLRDYFAGQALAGFLAASTGRDVLAKLEARMCYQMADAMLAARIQQEHMK